MTDLAESAEEQATGSAGEVTDQITDLAAVPETDGAANGATETVGQVADLVGDVVDQTVEQVEEAATEDGAGESRATNTARRKAEELGVDLDQIEGTGAGGLITIRDVVEP